MLPLLPEPPGVKAKLSPVAAVPADSVNVANSPAGPALGYATAISAPEPAVSVPEAMTELPPDSTSKVELEVNCTEIGWPNWLAGSRIVPAGRAALATGLPTIACTLPTLLPGVTT